MSATLCPGCGREVVGGRFCPGCGRRLDDPLLGRTIAGRFLVVDRGPSGHALFAYTAEHVESRAPFALRVLQSTRSEDPDARRRFLRAAEAMRGVRSPRLLAVHECGEERVADGGGGRLRVVYAVTDAPPGPSLERVVAEEGPLPAGAAVEMLDDVLEALTVLHASVGPHGDLTPACVYRERTAAGPRWTVGDAGLAPPARGTDPGELGSDGGRWIAPEQARGEPAGPAADLHAAALLLHFAVAGRPPRQAAAGDGLVYEIERAFPAPLAGLVGGGGGEALDSLLDRALAKDPRSRFADAAEFRAAVRTLPASPDDPAGGLILETGTGNIPVATPSGWADRADVPDARPVAGASDDETHVALRAVRPSPAASADETCIALPAAADPSPRTGRASLPAAPRAAAPADGAAPPAAPPAPRAGTERRPAPAAGREAATPSATRPRIVKEPAPRGEATPVPEPPPRPPRSGRWYAVGGPVAVFAILGFLGVGALYAAVWSGDLDGWGLPDWVRSLTGRMAPPVPPSPDDIPPRGMREIRIEAVLPAGLVGAYSGTPGERCGEWRLIAVGADGTEGGERVFARGDLAPAPPVGPGVPPEIGGDTAAPAGKFRVEVDVPHGSGASGPFTVDVALAGRQRVAVPVTPGRARLRVSVVPAVGRITVGDAGRRDGGGTVVKHATAGDVVFGLAQDPSDPPLVLGTTYEVTIEAAGFRTERREVALLADGQTLAVSLQRDDNDRVQKAVEKILKNLALPADLRDDDVLGEPEVKLALARVAAEPQGAWAEVRAHLLDVEGLLEQRLRPGGDGPADARTRALQAEAAAVRRLYHAHLASLAEAAADRADSSAAEAVAAAARFDLFPEPAAAAKDAAALARARVRAWVRAAEAGGPAAGGEESLVGTALPALDDSERAEARRSVAECILRHRALPAAARGDLAGLDRWLALAVQADPGVASLLDHRRLRAHGEYLAGRPTLAAEALLGREGIAGLPGNMPQWIPDGLPVDDVLLLARALRATGDLALGGEGPDPVREAKKYWKGAWNVYSRLFAAPTGEGAARDAAERVRRIALVEAAEAGIRLGELDTATRHLEQYAALDRALPGVETLDARARSLLAFLVGRELDAGAKAIAANGIALVEFPEGLYRPGTGPASRKHDEGSGRNAAPVVVEVPSAAEPVLIPRFWAGLREVSVRQYAAFLAAMADPAVSARYAHPAEPARKRAAGGRTPLDWAAQQADGDAPVRGVDWWDAYACAAFLGGRLPSEAEWDRLARGAGGVQPAEDPFPAIAPILGPAVWRSLWPLAGPVAGDLDRSPAGVRGVFAGVAEWCMDPADRVPSPPAADLRVDARPALPRGDETEMVVRGASFMHGPPGAEPGRSGTPATTAATGASRDARWRGASVTERRRVRAGEALPWIGFRIVHGPAAVVPR